MSFCWFCHIVAQMCMFRTFTFSPFKQVDHYIVTDTLARLQYFIWDEGTEFSLYFPYNPEVSVIIDKTSKFL